MCRRDAPPESTRCEPCAKNSRHPASAFLRKLYADLRVIFGRGGRTNSSRSSFQLEPGCTIPRNLELAADYSSLPQPGTAYPQGMAAAARMKNQEVHCEHAAGIRLHGGVGYGNGFSRQLGVAAGDEQPATRRSWRHVADAPIPVIHVSTRSSGASRKGERCRVGRSDCWSRGRGKPPLTIEPRSRKAAPIGS
jgi:hypothetical protein